MKLTEEQKEIVDKAKNMKENEIMKILALAGCGKTTTLIQITKNLPNKKFLYLAFNSAIAKEAKKKFGKNVDIFTTHALALKYISMFMQKKYGKKIQIINKFFYDDEDIPDYIKRDPTKVKKFFLQVENFLNSDKKLKYLLENEDLLNEKNIPAREIYDFIKTKIEKGIFNHSLYLKLFQILNFNIKKYDYVLLDEAQDTNNVTLSIFLNSFKNAKKIIVGDLYQQIYQFRGSINILNKIKENYLLFLTQSFRCPAHVTDIANYILFYWLNENKIFLKPAILEKKNNLTAFLSRTNAGLIHLISILNDFNTLRNPEEIFASSLALLDIFTKGLTTIPQYKWLNNFPIRMIKDQIIPNDKELYIAFKIFEKYNTSLPSLLKKAKNKNTKKSNTILATAHSVKGLEFKNVYICEDFTPFEDLKKDLEEKIRNEIDILNQEENFFDEENNIDNLKREEYIKQKVNFFLKQELNLFYVTVTRAISNLNSSSKNLSNLFKIFLKKGHTSKTFENFTQKFALKSNKKKEEQDLIALIENQNEINF